MAIAVSINQNEPVGYFWKIKKDGKTVAYLNGSLHIIPNDVPHLNSKMEKCFSKATCLAVEVDCTRKEDENTYNDVNIHRFKRIMVEYPIVIANAGISLRKLYSKEAEQVDFSSGDEMLGFVRENIDKAMKDAADELGIIPGIDFFLIDKAKEKQIPIEDLERLDDERIAYITEITDFEMKRLNILSSYEALRINDRDELWRFFISKMSEVKDMLTSNYFIKWKNGQSITQCIWKNSTVYDIKRNENIANRIIELINKNEKPFCCVGCAHTLEDKNVQQFLEKKGYIATRILIREVKEVVSCPIQ